jgi:hypothetical protein
MAQTSIAILKTKFETGDIPAEQDYINFFDSYVHYTQNGNVLRVSASAEDAQYTEIQAAHDALPATGGVILVDPLSSGDSDYNSFTVTTDNTHIIGVAPAEIDYGTGLLMDYGVRIEGTCQIRANNCHVHNISIHTVNTAADCLRFGNTKKNATASNLRLLGKTRSSAFHCLLVEGMAYVNISNVKTYRNIWGTAIKDSNVNISGLYAETHNNGPLIVKADNGSTIRNVNVSDCIYDGDGFGNFYVQSVSSSILYDVNFSNCISYDAGFLYSLEAGSTIEGVTFKGCKSRDATSNSWQFYGTSSSAIDLIGCSGLGAATNSVYMDDSTGHTNIVYSGCDFDNPVQGIRSDSRSAQGFSVTKTSVSENTATDICKIHHEDIDSTAYMVTIISNSTATQSSSIWLVTTAFSAINSVQLEESKFGVATVSLTPSIDTGTNEVTFNITVDQTSLTEAMRIEMQVIPLGARQQFLLTAL